jgi:Flp pilus assembly protein TadD
MKESVQQWLEELTTAPEQAVQRLILGQAAVGAWARASLREVFIEIQQTRAEALDVALTRWIESRLLGMPPENTPTVVWATHLQELFRAACGLPLPQLARLLRDRLRDFRSWLRPLVEAENLDPEAAFLAALAWSEANLHLEGMWRGIALRRNREPAYYTDLGLLGMRRSRDDQGRLPAKAPFSLLVTIIDLADANISKKEWLLTTRALLGGYRCSPKNWVREFDPVLAARAEAQNGPKWLKQIFPEVEKNRTNAVTNVVPIPLAESDKMVDKVAQDGLQAEGLAVFLDRHRTYATTTGNSHFLVRTFNRLAEKASTHDPDWAVARAEEALAWDKNDARNWTVLARCLWQRGLRAEENGDSAEARAAGRDALDTLWSARFSFPWEPFVRTELARMYRDAGQLELAEIIYRESAEAFPLNAACRNGLAEVLVLRGDFAQAEALYRETRADFPKDPYSRNGLAEILFHRSAAANDSTEREEARALFEEAARLQDRFAASRLASFDARWQRPAAAGGDEEAVREAATPAETFALSSVPPEAMRPAQRLGRSLLLQWRARRATIAEERDRLFSEAEHLLGLPDQLTGECQAALMEARGFLLLARERFAEAREYFAEKIAMLFPRSLVGLRLGLAEARLRLGEALDAAEEQILASFGPEGSILPLVLRVIRLLDAMPADAELRDLLLQLYPRVRELATIPLEGQEKAKGGRQPASVDGMVADLLATKVFIPAGVQSADDLQRDDILPQIRTTLQELRDPLLGVMEELAMAA